MNQRMLHQLESQPKRHHILVDGHEIYSGDVLLEALQQYNAAQKQYQSRNIEFKSACTDGEGQ